MGCNYSSKLRHGCVITFHCPNPNAISVSQMRPLDVIWIYDPCPRYICIRYTYPALTYKYSISHKINTWLCFSLLWLGYDNYMIISNPCDLFTHSLLGHDSIYKCHLNSIGNPIVEIRRSYNCLISTMGFLILDRRHLWIRAQLLLLALGQSYDWPSANKVILLVMGKSSLYQTTTNQIKGGTMCIIFSIYCKVTNHF